MSHRVTVDGVVVWWCGVTDCMSSRKGQDDVSVMVLPHTHEEERVWVRWGNELYVKQENKC